MPERDANQLAAGEAIALLRRRIDNLASDSRDDAGHAALDELVALVGTLQAEVERLRDVLEDEPEAVRLLSERVGTLQQERDAERRWCKHWAERAEAAEAALATTRQALADIESGALKAAQLLPFTVSTSVESDHRADHSKWAGWLLRHKVLPVARRALADTGGDTA